MEERKLNAQEASTLAGVSSQTLSAWYRFKKECPDSEYAQLLPEFTREGKRRTRYWKESDVEALKRFKESIPQGRNGVLGCVTQKYVKKPGSVSDTSSAAAEGILRKRKSGEYISDVSTFLEFNGVEPETVQYIVELLMSEREWKQRLAQ